MDGIRVLVVDDEKDFTSSFSRILKRRGFKVDVAADGLLALHFIARSSFDVVVLDIRMPGMNGFRVLREIKRLAPITQVILLSGQFPAKPDGNASCEGAFAAVMKPFPVMNLLDMIISAAVHGRRLRRLPRGGSLLSGWECPGRI